MSIIKIKHGVTFKGKPSTLGIILSIIGIIIMVYPYYNGEFSLFLFYFGLILLFVGILLFLSIRGVLIDKENNSIKSYLFLGVKIGKWESLDDYYEVKLIYINMTQSLGLRGAATNIHTESFDIVLVSEIKKNFFLKDFINYEKAMLFMKTYAELLNKPCIDGFEEMKQSILERKQYVRR
jgi:hypothetical protein